MISFPKGKSLMKHHIIVKFTDEVADKPALCDELEALFAEALAVEGIRGVELKRNCVPRANRYDLMIVIELEANALPTWDECAVHKLWKSRYGSLVASKAIFDCE